MSSEGCCRDFGREGDDPSLDCAAQSFSHHIISLAARHTNKAVWRLVVSAGFLFTFWTSNHPLSMMINLTEEQKARIEANRQRALAIRRQKEQEERDAARRQQVSSSSTHSSTASSKSATQTFFGKPKPLPTNTSNQIFPIKPTTSQASNVGSKHGFSASTTKTNAPSKSPFAMISHLNSKASVNSSKPTQRLGQNKPKEAIASQPSQSSTTATGKKKLRITVKLMSASFLLIEFPYHLLMKDLVQQVPSKFFVFDKKAWKIKIEDYNILVQKLKEARNNPTWDVCPELDATSVPPNVISAILDAKQRSDLQVNLEDRLTKTLIDNLFPFQREGVKFAIKQEGRCIIGDEMGLGKTIQAIAIANWYMADWPMLVVCPASVVRGWKKHLLTWLKHVKEHQIAIVEKPGPYPFDAKIIIMSYDRMKACENDIKKSDANVMIFDESHNLKSHKSQRTKSGVTIAKDRKRVILLSGTPALSRPIELYPQLLIVDPKMFPKMHDFGLRYCDAKQLNFGPYPSWDYKGNSNTDELRILLESTVMIRRMKKDVLRDLPPKNRQKVSLPVELTPEQSSRMTYFKEQVGKVTKITNDIKTDLMKWFSESAEVKIPAVTKYIEKLLDKDRQKKFIIFCHHRVMSEGLMQFLEQKQISFIIINGETLPKLRQECCDVFQTNDRVRVAVVSIVAAGVGVTLTAAHHVVFAELFWNPGIINQAEDRAHRIGQEDTVLVEYLIAKETVDELIWGLISKKLNVLEKVGLGGEHLTKESIVKDSHQRLISDFLVKQLTKAEIPEELQNEFELDLDENSDDVEAATNDKDDYDSPKPGPSGLSDLTDQSQQTKGHDTSDDDIVFDDDDDVLLEITSSTLPEPTTKKQKVEEDEDKNGDVIDISESPELGDDFFDAETDVGEEDDNDVTLVDE